MNTTRFVRGMIVLAELNGEGYQQQGVRPSVIIGNDKGNEHSPLLIVSPLTSKDKKYMPTHTDIYPTLENGLTVKSTVLAEQIVTLNKTSVKKILGCLSEYDLRRVNRAIQVSLAL